MHAILVSTGVGWGSQREAGCNLHAHGSLLNARDLKACMPVLAYRKPYECRCGSTAGRIDRGADRPRGGALWTQHLSYPSSMPCTLAPKFHAPISPPNAHSNTACSPVPSQLSGCLPCPQLPPPLGAGHASPAPAPAPPRLAAGTRMQVQVQVQARIWAIGTATNVSVTLIKEACIACFVTNVYYDSTITANGWIHV